MKQTEASRSNREDRTLHYASPAGPRRRIPSRVAILLAASAFGGCLGVENPFRDRVERMRDLLDDDSIDESPNFDACEDDDGGDPNFAGSVFASDEDGTTMLVLDECSGSALQVNERWCYRASDGRWAVGTLVYDCPNGCVDGACAPSNDPTDDPSTFDSPNFDACKDDDGTDPNAAGSVFASRNDGTVFTVADECSGSAFQVNEQWCYRTSDGRWGIGTMVFDCPRGCVYGACLE